MAFDLKGGLLGMPIAETDWQKLSKIPNEFLVKSKGFNTRYKAARPAPGTINQANFQKKKGGVVKSKKK